MAVKLTFAYLGVLACVLALIVGLGTQSGALNAPLSSAAKRSLDVSLSTQDAALATINLAWSQADTIRVYREALTQCKAVVRQRRMGR